MTLPEELELPVREARQIARSLASSKRHAYRASPLLQVAMPELLTELTTRTHPQRVRYLSALVLRELATTLTTERQGGTEPTTEARIARFCDELSRRCEEAWTLPSMASACGLGRSRFADLVRQTTGDTPMRLLNRLRVERARLKLRSSDDSIVAIALSCGFTTSQYFAETFKKFTGESASDYRERTHKGSTNEPRRRLRTS